MFLEGKNFIGIGYLLRHFSQLKLSQMKVFAQRKEFHQYRLSSQTVLTVKTFASLIVFYTERISQVQMILVDGSHSKGCHKGNRFPEGNNFTGIGYVRRQFSQSKFSPWKDFSPRKEFQRSRLSSLTVLTVKILTKETGFQ